MSDSLPLISVDTNIVSAIVRENEYGAAYFEFLVPYTPALTFFVRGELASATWTGRRADRLAQMFQRLEPLPDPDQRTIDAFISVRSAANSLGLGKSLGSDAWILAQTVALGLPFVSHDSSAIRTAERARVDYFTLNKRAITRVERDRAALG